MIRHKLPVLKEGMVIDMSLYCKIKKQFSDFGLNIEIDLPDHITSLMGASGSGKSLTLRCIAGIEKPDEGVIILNGKTLFDSSKHINLPPQKRKVGMLFQDYALFPNMTVAQNIAVGLADKSRLPIILKQYQLETLSSHYPHELSGGQKQRCALARMMATQPDMILLDEPFSALDHHMRWQLEQELIQELKKYPKPVLYVSHDSNEIYRISESVITIDAGLNQPIRKKQDIFLHPHTRQDALLIGCKNVFSVKRNEHMISIPDLGISFEAPADIPDIVKYIGIPDQSISANVTVKTSMPNVSYTVSSCIEERKHYTFILHLKDAVVPLYWSTSAPVIPSSGTLAFQSESFFYLK